MSVAEGVEAKELRKALKESLQYVGIGHSGECTQFTNPPVCVCGRDKTAKAGKDALSRDKTRYEREAELMENVVSATNKFRHALEVFRQKRPASQKLGDMPFERQAIKTAEEDLLESLKALDEFRAKK